MLTGRMFCEKYRPTGHFSGEYRAVESFFRRRGLHPIWWKLSKKEWEEMHEKIPEEIYFPPEKIILLKQ